MRLSILMAFFSVLIVSQPALARKFSFNNEVWGAYFRGSGGLSRLEQKPFSGVHDGTNIPSYNAEEHTINYSGELGFIFNFGESLSFRAGAEMLQAKVSEVQGSAPGTSTKWFDLTSKLFVFNTTATIEYHYYRDSVQRLSVFAGAGYSLADMDIEYKFTGSSPYGVADYTEKSDSLFISAHYGVQYERLLLDTVTIVTELGYRHMPITSFEYKHNVTTIDGAKTAGSEVKNNDGSTRSLDLGGYYAGLAFRFWLEF